MQIPKSYNLNEIIQMAFLSIMCKMNAITNKNVTFSSKIWIIKCDFGLNMIQSNSKENLILLNHHSMPKSSPKSNRADKGYCCQIFCQFVSYLCQVEGHGETLSKFSLKISKIFPRQIWKIFSGFIHLRPLYRNMILIWLDTQWERL